MASDFHTHDPSPPVRALISSVKPLPGKLTSLQRHPWELPENFVPSILPQSIQLNDFAALGEIGLDKVRGVDYTVQQQYFTELLKIAADCRKPVVIHNVHSFAEIFAALKMFPTVKVMWHGFRSSPQMLDELWKRHITVSFHPAAVNSPALMKKLCQAAGAYGFESDDDRTVSIKKLLTEAEKISSIRNMENVTDQYFADFLEL